jgi:serine/threonine-protein kinase
MMEIVPADAGIRFGQYVLLRRLARGGMAEVFLAQQRGLEGFDRRVAVKRILPHLADSPDFVKMFLGEARLAAQLSHPNIVHIYEFGKVEQDYFIAMEYVEGVHAGQLWKHGEAGDKLPATLVARIGADAATALHHAHELRDQTGKPYGLVHRDVSPANIMISYDGVVKLCDFGIAKAAALGDQLTNPGQVKGKYAYMSPEQTVASALDGRSDVFSLAIVLWELLTGKYIVPRGDAVEAMRRLRDGRLEPIDQAAPDVPRGLADAITWALQPRDRRATATEFAQALEAFIKSSPEIANAMQLGAWVRKRFVREHTGKHAAIKGPSATTAMPQTGESSAAVTPPGKAGLPIGATLPAREDDTGLTVNAGPFSQLDITPTVKRASDPAAFAAEHATTRRSTPGPRGAVYPPPGPTSGTVTVADAQIPADQEETVAAPPPLLHDHEGTTRPVGPPFMADTPVARPHPAPPETSSIPAIVGPSGPAGTNQSPRVRIAEPSAADRASVASMAGSRPSMREPTPRPSMASGPRATHEPTPRPSTHDSAARHSVHDATPRPSQFGATRPGAGFPESGPRLRPTPLRDPRKPRRTAGPRRGLLIGASLAGITTVSFLIALAVSGSHDHHAPTYTVRDAGAVVMTPGDAAAAATPPPPAAPDAAAAPTVTAVAAQLEVHTIPDGAVVHADDQTRTAPAQLALPSGHHVITVELAGYEPERRELDLAPGEKQTIEIAFAHKLARGKHAGAGRLTARTTPASEVWEGDRRLGQTPLSDYELAAGQHTLTFKHASHPTVIKTIDITAGKLTKLSFQLP